MREYFKIMKRHLLTGTSHMIPFIVAGGILLAMSVMFSPDGITQSVVDNQIFVSGLSEIGHAGLTLFIPVLGGYIAYSIADRPGLAPGMCGAWVAKNVRAGFFRWYSCRIYCRSHCESVEENRITNFTKIIRGYLFISSCGNFINWWNCFLVYW